MLSSRLAAKASALLLLGTVLSSGPAEAEPVDDYAGYEPQTTCATETLPGTDFLLRYLVRTNPGTGYSSTLRDCSSGGTSEHKDGRALDWMVDAADAQQRAVADRMLDRLLTTDRRGNRHALARRMGIMYIIWNDHIWSSYGGFEKRDYLHSACPSLRRCSKTLRHRDHVHISLSRSGAAAQTSFYRSRNVPSVPVLFPGTLQLDPVRTAVAKIDVPADGSTVTTGFKLTRGTTYRIVGEGLYRFGPGSRIADAACVWAGGRWSAGSSLLVNETRPWTTDCDGRHTHVTTYQAPATDFLRLRVADGSPRDNEGSLRFHILRDDIALRAVAARLTAGDASPRAARRNGARAKALRVETVTVRASRARGAVTRGALRRTSRYKLVVTGVARSGDTVFDGACVRYAGRLRPQHTLDLTQPAADHLSLFVQGVKVNLRAPASRTGCDGRTHRYVGTFKPAVAGTARLRVWDPYRYGDNSGALSVTVRRR